MDTTVTEPPQPPADDVSDLQRDSTESQDHPLLAPADRIVGGVSALIAQQLGLDALWVRIGFVVLALTSGLGLVVYAALWLILIAEPLSRWRGIRMVGGVILLAGVPLALHIGDPEFVDGPLAIVALLIGLTLALWQPRRETAPQPTPPIPNPVRVSPQVDKIRAQLTRPRRIRRLRQPSLLGRTTLGLSLAVAAIGAIIDQANGGRLHPEQWLGIATGVCGLGLLAGTVRGRARWLIIPAVGFAAAGYVGGELARLNVGLDDLQGSRYIYLSESETSASPSQRIGFGDVNVNIAAAPPAPRTYDARAVFGDIWVSADENVAVDVRLRTDNGAAGYTDTGPVTDGVIRLGPSGPADVTVNAWVAHGNVYLTNYRAEPSPEIAIGKDAAARLGSTEPFRQDADIATRDDLGTVPELDRLDGPMIQIDEYLTATTDGWFDLLNGTAIIDPAGQAVAGDEVVEDGNGTVRIVTEHGEFELLPRGILIRPDGNIVDLPAVRAEIQAGRYEQP